ncbi:hypothetical protein cypCar_00017275 [Cyprinus carpio]|nr:hypothetical protein cypCar_00017275 [Cyprinus carpio]
MTEFLKFINHLNQKMRTAKHLLSEMHHSFIQNDSNYAVVDQLMAAMVASFVCNPNLEVDPTLIKSSTGFFQLQLCNLTENTVSENEKSLQTPLVQECDRLLAITDNRGNLFPTRILVNKMQPHTLQYKITLLILLAMSN